jgi:hypothetical protein
MLETHIVMSLLIFHLVLILMFRLALTLVLHLALLLMSCLISLIDLTITHMILVHERTALSLDALVTAHVLIVMIVSHVDLLFLLEGLTLTLSLRWKLPRKKFMLCSCCFSCTDLVLEPPDQKTRVFLVLLVFS